jgi:uncharacterized protein YjiS (DUF1127 family)
MTVLHLHLPAAPRRTWLKIAEAKLTRALDRLLDGRDRARQCRQLLGLSDAALKDFAASRADAERASRSGGPGLLQ